jgi:hypothetical protein
MKFPSCGDRDSKLLEARAVRLKARGGRLVCLRRRSSGVWCSEWMCMVKYRSRRRWLSLLTKDEGVACQRFDKLLAEFGDAAAMTRQPGARGTLMNLIEEQRAHRSCCRRSGR